MVPKAQPGVFPENRANSKPSPHRGGKKIYSQEVMTSIL